MSVESLIQSAVTALVSIVLGWLIASFRKLSPGQLDAFEERVINPISKRVDKLEERSEHFCTRDELKEAVERVEVASETNRRENREDFQTVFRRLEGLSK